MLKKIYDVFPRARGGALVWIPDLRKAVNLPLAVLNVVLFDLARKDEIIFHRHAHPARITEDERFEFLYDGENYYVGFALNDEAGGLSKRRLILADLLEVFKLPGDWSGRLADHQLVRILEVLQAGEGLVERRDIVSKLAQVFVRSSDWCGALTTDQLGRILAILQE